MIVCFYCMIKLIGLVLSSCENINPASLYGLPGLFAKNISMHLKEYCFYMGKNIGTAELPNRASKSPADCFVVLVDLHVDE